VLLCAVVCRSKCPEGYFENDDPVLLSTFADSWAAMDGEEKVRWLPAPPAETASVRPSSPSNAATTIPTTPDWWIKSTNCPAVFNAVQGQNPAL
jgi:hypothetical protein